MRHLCRVEAFRGESNGRTLATHSSPAFIYCISISVSLSCQNAHTKEKKNKEKRTRVQAAPAAIVRYDTARHFGHPINKMASFRVVLVHYIPLWPQATGKWLRAFDSSSTVQSFLLAVLRCLFVVRGEREDASSEDCDSRGLSKSLATATPRR